MFIKRPIISLSFRQHINSYVGSLFTNFWIIVLVSGACTALFVTPCAFLPQSYHATATICFSNQAALQTVAGWDPTSGRSQFLATQTRLIQSDPVLRPVAERYRLLEREQQRMRPWPAVNSSVERSAIRKSPVVLHNLSITGVAGAVCLNITYGDRNPQVAADVANAIANSFLSSSGIMRDGIRNSATPTGEELDNSKDSTTSSHAALFVPMFDLGAPGNNNAAISFAKPALPRDQNTLGPGQEEKQAIDAHRSFRLMEGRNGAAYRATFPSGQATQCDMPAVIANANVTQMGESPEEPTQSTGPLEPLSNNLRFVDPARPPARPTFPNWTLLISSCFTFSFASISVCCFLVGKHDFTTDDPAVLETLLGANVISKLPHVESIHLWLRRGLGRTLSWEFRLDGVLFDEGIRLLQSDMLLSSPKGACKTIVVTSALPGEGKTTVAVSLAVGYATQGKRTLLIDADLRCPTVEERLRLFPPGQLEGVLSRTLSWKEALIERLGYRKFAILSSPAPLHGAIGVLAGCITDILNDPELEFDVVILDAPPLLGCAETNELSAVAGVTLLCVRSGQTPVQVQKVALERLKQVGATFGGIVLNGCTRRKDSTYIAYEKYHASNAYQSRPEVLRPSQPACSPNTLRR